MRKPPWIALVTLCAVLIAFHRWPHSPRNVSTRTNALMPKEFDASGRWTFDGSARMHFRGRESASMLECEGTRARQERIASFAFQTRDGPLFSPYGKDEWSDEAVIRHLLSQSAFLIVGDSLAAQMYAAFRSLFGVGHLVEGRYDRRELLPSGKLVDLDKSLLLSGQHPLLTRLASIASPTRLKAPLVQHIRSHHLLNVSTLEQTFADLGTPITRTGYPWGDDPDWLSLVRKRLEEGPVTLVLLTGPHWSRVHFEFATEPADADRAILDAYHSMTRQVIASLPDSPNLRVVIRGLSPARHNCSSEGVSPDLSPTDVDTFVFDEQKYNYALFEQFNEHWREAVRAYASDPAGRATQVAFWPVWNMTGKRLDAYSKPEHGDCLHFCLPVVRTLVKMLMHRLMSETRE